MRVVRDGWEERGKEGKGGKGRKVGREVRGEEEGKKIFITTNQLFFL